ncbi:uncharacterized protein TRUGW13939_05271 [Talaromyces rugulosus]|uniref:MARVEL domain-containing protein n=1 Tax=Talaromyces rugulosus TaxID=121627 RepID=A0A7H8QVT8_TALRU|nr:uncharacterized protein TRUGW13939_05271 [Talaromyces rugulosus]QKX58150.1 hypothetical protein TRUGW13939_05271 [Talaromyces rugulosus]
MTSTKPSFTTSLPKFFLIANRVLQWASSVIVLGITSYFINKGVRGLTTTYVEIIAAISVAAFLPAFVSPFLPASVNGIVLGIDVIFSYLWLAAFIFSALDYNRNDCLANAPPGFSCSKKWANEAFIFLTFIFTFFSILFETWTLWLSQLDKHPLLQSHEKTSQPDIERNGAQPTTQNNTEEPTTTTA